MRRVYLILPLFYLLSCAGETADSVPEEPASEVLVSDDEESAEDSPDEMIEEIPAEIKEETQDKCDTDFTAYVYDPGEKVTNVRNAPGGEVVMSLSWEIEEEYMLWIDRYEKGWFHLKGDILGIEADFEIPGGEGWVHNSVIAIDTRNYADQIIPIYGQADTKSDILGEIPGEWGGIRVKKACENYVFITFDSGDGTMVEGWIEEKWVCGNPLTTCS